jgi:hypothetical protein
MIGLHLAVQVIRPLIFQWEEVERHRGAAVDDLFGRECGFGFRLIEHERLGTDLKCFLHETLGTERRTEGG